MISNQQGCNIYWSPVRTDLYRFQFSRSHSLNMSYNSVCVCATRPCREVQTRVSDSRGGTSDFNNEGTEELLLLGRTPFTDFGGQKVR